MSERRARSKGKGASKGTKKTTGYVSILEVKEGDDGEYMQFTNNPNVVIEINGVNVNGKYIYLNDPADKYDKFVESGHMTEEEADEAIAKIPSFVLDEGTLKLD